MRILFLTRSLEGGGAERQLALVARGLHRKDHSVTVVTFYGGGSHERELREAGVPVVVLAKRGRWDVGWFLWKLISVSRTIKPHTIHGYLPVPNLLALALKVVVPRAKIVWGIRASNVSLDHYDWLTKVTFYASCLASIFADIIIVNSNAGLKYHAACGYPVHKMLVIPNGIDTDEFKPDATARLGLRSEWGISNGQKLVGLVGRLDPMKGHEAFFQAAQVLSRIRNDVRFVCVGVGSSSYTEELKNLAAQVGISSKLIWAGHRTDMRAVYNALDVLCSSSSFGEGFSNVVGEAMACGTPSIVTDVGDSARIVGDPIRVAPPRNPVALAAAIGAILDGDTEELARSCRFRIESLFSVEALVTATELALTQGRA